MQPPLLSIITINRNNAEGLRKTMESVFNLEFTDFEHIIIDGASTDGSIPVIQEFLRNPDYAQKVTYWVSEPDTGIYNAMNKGLRHARGKLVNMMNSGDCFLPDALSTLRQREKENPGTVLYGAAKRIKDGNFFDVLGLPYTNLINSGLCHQAVFIPRTLHDKHGLYDEKFKICADYDFLLRCFLNGEGFVFLDRITCSYDLGGISGNARATRQEVHAIQKAQGIWHPPHPLRFLLKLLLPHGVILLHETRESRRR